MTVCLRLLPLLAVAVAASAEGVQVVPGNGGGRATPRPATAAPAGGSAASEVDRDIVLLDNEQVIYGKVQSKPDDPVVEINTGSGHMRIPRPRVKKIVLGLESQRSRMGEADLDQLVAFAQWCLARNRAAEALGALDRAVTMPGVDVEVRGMHAQLVDEARGPKVALPLYRRYRQDGGNNTRIIGRLQELEQALASHNEELRKLSLPPVDVSAAVAATPAEAPDRNGTPGAAPPGKAGLEGKGWEAEAVQWSLPTQTKVVTLPPEEGGSRVLSVASPGKPAEAPAPGKHAPDKVAIKKTVNYAVDENAVLAFHVRNRTSHPLKLAIALKTSDKWEFYESIQQVVAPDTEFKELRWNLKASTFKSKATNWANTGTIASLDQVKELQVLVYNHGDDVDLLIQGMSFIKDTEM